jgi:hypothetical protein
MAPPNNNNGQIDKLDFPSSRGERRPLLHDRSEPSPGPSSETSGSGSFFEQVAEGIQERDRAMMKQEVIRYGSFICAILSWYDIYICPTTYTIGRADREKAYVAAP